MAGRFGFVTAGEEPAVDWHRVRALGSGGPNFTPYLVGAKYGCFVHNMHVQHLSRYRFALSPESGERHSLAEQGLRSRKWWSRTCEVGLVTGPSPSLSCVAGWSR